MANQFLIAGGDGLWNSAGNWATTSGAGSNGSHPVAGDVVVFDSNSGNANITVSAASACASLVMSGTYAGTLTFNSTLTLTSTCTFLSTCTIAGTAGTLILTGAATLTSGGKTLTCAMTFGANVTWTLADDWTVNGLVTVSGVNTPTINGSSRVLTCAGGLTTTGTNGAPTGTAKLSLTGGTWSMGTTGTVTINVDLAGTVTVSGTVSFGAASRTLKYVSGTITVAGSTLNLANGAVLDTAGMTWNDVATIGTSPTINVSSTFAWSGTLTFGVNTAVTVAGAGALNGTGAVVFGAGVVTLTLNNTGGLTTTGTMTLGNQAQTFAGSAGWTVGTLTNTSYSVSRIVTLTFGNTYRVTAALGNVGTSTTIRQAIKSGTGGSKVVFNVTAGATNTLTNCDPTDVDSSAGATVVSVGGTITTTLNWTGSTVVGSGGGKIFRSAIIEGVAA